jgi:hypothetical protein
MSRVKHLVGDDLHFVATNVLHRLNLTHYKLDGLFAKVECRLPPSDTRS